WFEYAPQFLTAARIDGGVAFWQAHADALARAERDFGVPPEIIVAIVGVETFYGRNVGSYRVIDALTTLAFDYPRRAACAPMPSIMTATAASTWGKAATMRSAASRTTWHGTTGCAGSRSGRRR